VRAPLELFLGRARMLRRALGAAHSVL